MYGNYPGPNPNPNPNPSPYSNNNNARHGHGHGHGQVVGISASPQQQAAYPYNNAAYPQSQSASSYNPTQPHTHIHPLTALLQRLPYHNPPRVHQDVSPLLHPSGFAYGHFSSCGASTYVTNDGLSLELLVLQGTIAINFQNAKYNIPVELFLPVEYPQLPPLAFVRPTSTMEVRPGHSSVDSNGAVSLQHVHAAQGGGWSAATSNLFGLCAQLSQIFSAEPPVWTRPANKRPVVATEPLQPQSSSSSQSSKSTQSTTQPATTQHARLVQRLNERLRGELETYFGRLVRERDAEEAAAERLAASARAVEQRIVKARRDRDRMRALAVDVRMQKTPALDLFRHENETETRTDSDSKLEWEKYIIAHDPLSEQVLQLQAQGRALEDAMEVLSEALQQQRHTHITLDACLSETRDLASKQFRSRADLARIKQALALA